MNQQTALRRSMILVIFLLCISPFSFSQNNFKVSGKVTDEAGKPLAGVTVRVKGKTTATATKPDGSFEINAPSENATLVFSSIGFAEQEVPLNKRNQVEITMATAVTSLQDVVVVGYGTQKKSDVTGSLSRITADVIQERPAQNILQAIQGKAAGVQVSSNFKPGELPVVRVRGNRSLGATNDPLYVLDGIPLVNALGVNSFTMSDINPNDIVSIEILKDASATAIYGSRGANGVVLITTNKGKKGRVTLGYNSTISLDSYKSLTDWMDGGQYVDRWRLSLINGRQYHNIANNSDFNVPAVVWYPNPKDDSTMVGFTDPVAIASVMMGYDWNPDGTVKMRATSAAEQALGWPAQVPVYNSQNIRSHNWLNDAVRQGVTQNHQISVTAGNDVSRLSLSLGYYNQLGVQKDQDYKRFTANISGDVSPTKWFTLGTSVIASVSIQNFGIQGPNTSNTGSKDLYSRASDQFPYALPTDANGFSIRNPGGNLSLWNPLIDISQSLNERRTAAVLANMYSEIKFTPWLKYRVNFGAQYRHFRSASWTGPDATSHLTNKPNTAAYATEENFSYVVENLLYFDKTFAKVHKVGITLLQSSQKSRKENSSTSVSGNINPLSLWYDLGSNTVGNPGGYGTGFTENTLTSFMGRLNYTLMDKYLLTASGRYDGASVLAPGHKWDFFPSFALAWKMQQEKFLNSVRWIDELKPRFGYGVVGNSSVQPYTTSGPLSRNPYVFGSTAGIGYLPQLVQNPDLKWESTAETNIGLDFALFRNRLSGSIEVYQQKTSDLILPKTLPAVSGYVQKIENIGKTSNKGIEITLSGTPIRKGNFSWDVDLNWSKNSEKIVELINGKQDLIASGWFIGQPLQVFYNYANAGIWGSSAKDLADMALFNANGTNFRPGTIKVVDQNGDYKINSSDFVVLGSPRPAWTGGITNTFHYKNWSLSSFIYFRWGQMYFGGYPNSYGGVNPNGRVENNLWSWTNPNGRWPMPNSSSAITNLTAAMQYNDGSFGAVKNISLSYTFTKKLIQRIGLNDLVLNFQMINPVIFGPGVVKWGINPDDDTNWSIASSNTNPLGGTNNNTILPQSIVIGIRAGF
ncbi:MAG: TonB-dependent receptor [Bacteroidota bacterium]|nr:TonB-dependent receptor [Bacteroidota bacterium]